MTRSPSSAPTSIAWPSAWVPSSVRAASSSPRSRTTCARRSPSSRASRTRWSGGPPTRRTPQRLAVIGRESDRLAALVDDLLTLSQAGAGVLRMRHARFRVASLLAEVAERVDVLAAGLGVVVETRVLGGEWLVGDRRRLAQVLTNLATNATRHTPPGGRIVLTAEVAADGSAELGVVGRRRRHRRGRGPPAAAAVRVRGAVGRRRPRAGDRERADPGARRQPRPVAPSVGRHPRARSHPRAAARAGGVVSVLRIGSRRRSLAHRRRRPARGGAPARARRGWWRRGGGRRAGRRGRAAGGRR